MEKRGPWQGGSIRLADEEGKVILAEPTSVSGPPTTMKKQELSECLRQQQGTLACSPPHPESHAAYPECTLEG